MVELLFLCTLSRGMKDCCFTTLFSPGKAWVCYESMTLRYICLLIYYTGVWKTSQPLKDECLYLYFKGCLGTLCLGLRRKSLLRSLRNLRCLLISERCIFNTVLSIAWLDLPMDPIHLSFCNHLFQFFYCHADLHWSVCLLVVDVEDCCINHYFLFYSEKKEPSVFGQGFLTATIFNCIYADGMVAGISIPPPWSSSSSSLSANTSITKNGVTRKRSVFNTVQS